MANAIPSFFDLKTELSGEILDPQVPEHRCILPHGVQPQHHAGETAGDLAGEVLRPSLAQGPFLAILVYIKFIRQAVRPDDKPGTALPEGDRRLHMADAADVQPQRGLPAAGPTPQRQIVVLVLAHIRGHAGLAAGGVHIHGQLKVKAPLPQPGKGRRTGLVQRDRAATEGEPIGGKAVIFRCRPAQKAPVPRRIGVFEGVYHRGQPSGPKRTGVRNTSRPRV